MNRNIYVNGMEPTCCTGKLLKLTRNKQEENKMLNVFMNVLAIVSLVRITSTQLNVI